MEENKHMSDLNAQPSANRYDDQDFDLFEVISILWQGKFWIAGAITISLLLGLLYVSTTHERWTSKARIIAPEYRDIQLISDYLQQLKPVFGDDFGHAMEAVNVSSADDIFKRFMTLFNSPDNKYEYVLSSDLIQNNFRANQAADNAMRNMAESIKSGTERNDTQVFELTISSWSADSSRTLLENYINFTSSKTAEQIHANLESLLEQRTKELKRSLEFLTANTKNRITTSIDHLSHSLAIASAAGIEVPIVDPGTGNAEEFMINMGTRAIKAKIEELKSIENFAVIEPKLLTLQNQLAASANVNMEGVEHFKPYETVQAPTTPLFRDHPKKAIAIVISLFIGGIVGCIYVLIAHAIHMRKHKI